MKHSRFLVIGLLLSINVFLTIYLISYYATRPVVFEDPNLEHAVRVTLNQAESDITVGQLKRLRSFEAVDEGISSLEGIQHMTNLRSLNLEDNSISDVEPLKELTSLKELNLRNNKITSLENANFDQLTDLTQLKTLNLSHNVATSAPGERNYKHRLEDISLLSSFPSLEFLFLRDNHIKDPSPLAELTALKELDISQNPIINGDLSVLHHLKSLEELNLRETNVIDISFLSEMNQLTYLNLHSNININSVEPIAELTELETLIIPNVPLKEDIEVIKELYKLRRLNVRNTGITDVNVIANLMQKGALQDRIESDLVASIDISLNPIPLEEQGDTNGFFPIRDYWGNISDRVPETLLTPKTKSVLLNEYMASNSETYSDGSGDYYDWIELYNPTDESIDLEGYYLSDDPANLTRFRIPVSKIDAKSTLIIFASGLGSIDSDHMIHTNFSLDRQGEPIILTEPDQTTIVDYFPPRQVPQDMSYGRLASGDDFGYFYDPSPGEPNATDGFKTLPEEPKVSHVGGFYKSEFELTFDVPDGHTVYYTTTGSPPTDNSRIYSEPIEIKKKIPAVNVTIPSITTIRAVSYDEYGNKSNVITHSYIIGQNVDRYFSMPVFSINTHPSNLYDEQRGLFAGDNAFNRGRAWERPGVVELFEPNGVRVLNQDIGIRTAGGFSRGLPQKSLRLYARGSYDAEDTFDYAFFDELIAKDGETVIDQFQRITLRNSGNDWDNAKFRDPLMHEIASPLDDIAGQASRPSVVFINGEYWGIYNIRERQDVYYVESHYNVNPDEVTILFGPDAVYDKGDPSGTSHFHDTMHYIERHDLAEEKHYQYVADRIDIDNLIDHFISQIYFANFDWPWNNFRFWRYNGVDDGTSEYQDGRWRFLLYDTDWGFARHPEVVDDTNTHLDHTHDTVGMVLNDNKSSNFLFVNLNKNEHFKEQFVRRLQNHTNITFNSDRVTQLIEDFRANYENEMPKQLSRWHTLDRDMNKWHREVNRMLDFAKRRPNYVLHYLNKYYNLGNRINIVIERNDPNGQVLIDGLAVFNDQANSIKNQTWEGQYFSGLPITVTAEGNKGYHFVGWELPDGSIETDKELIINEDITLKPVFKANSLVSSTNYESDIREAKILLNFFSYLSGFSFSFVSMWIVFYFVKETSKRKVKSMIPYGMALAILLTIPAVITVSSFGLQALFEQFHFTLFIISIIIGLWFGTTLPHPTKGIRTFEA